MFPHSNLTRNELSFEPWKGGEKCPRGLNICHSAEVLHYRGHPVALPIVTWYSPWLEIINPTRRRGTHSVPYYRKKDTK